MSAVLLCRCSVVSHREVGFIQEALKESTSAKWRHLATQINLPTCIINYYWLYSTCFNNSADSDTSHNIRTHSNTHEFTVTYFGVSLEFVLEFVLITSGVPDRIIRRPDIRIRPIGGRISG